jgi:DNA polymerase-3 subunit delta'
MFEHLIGNQPVKDTIRRFLSSGRVPNSLLFAGPEGVGKKQFALELAKAIVCRESSSHEACGSCAACLRAGVFEFPPVDERDDHEKVIFSKHADVGQVIPYKRNVLVGAIRDLEREANFRPYEANARVFIIDDAEKMNDSASNALLKTLEEPAATTHIFLVGSKPNALLPTIRSRVQTVRFGPIDTDQIERLLLETHKYSQEDARLIAASSGGSVSRAVSLDIAGFRERRTAALDLIRTAIVDRDIVGLLINADKMAGAKTTPEFESFLDVFETLVYQIWSVKVGRPGGTLPTDIVDLAADANTDTLAEWLQDIEEIRDSLAVNINKKIAADDLLVKMAAG